ncbi:MAG: glycosyltransferase family 39 protein, partial [Ancalomicrobiaceae bacterium]|nr:glycosyltransferase family 39 protein [Ancalomicrobiaceae bacterium]
MQKSLTGVPLGLSVDTGVLYLVGFILLQGLAWVLIPALTYASPPLDVVESLMWGREWLLTSYKHPALPSWALEVGRLATGSALWSPYVVSQVFIAATYLLVYRLGRELMSPGAALAGTLLLAGLTYFTWVAPEFNHNIAQMPVWAAIMLVLWWAVEGNRLWAWLLLGVLAAAGFYTKFSVIVVLAACGLWMLIDAKARSRWLSPGPWLAIAVTLVLVVPLVRALAAVHFLPLTYLADRSGDATPRLAEFVTVILADHALLIALAFAVGIRPWRRGNGPRPAVPQEAPI